MNALRLVMVTSRFWPLVGEGERFVSSLVQQLRSELAETTILTARWSGDWPSEVVHREVRIVRLPHAPRGGWSTIRHVRSVAAWLREHHRQVDLVYVLSLRQVAYAAIRALRDKPVAVVLRAEIGDCQWLERAGFAWGMKRRSIQADAIVTPTRSLESELAGAGFAPRQVHYMANGVEVAEPRTAATRFQARAALAEVNHDLGVAEYAPVAVSVVRLDKNPRVVELIEAWRPIAARWPSSRLWLLGDGPSRESLHERIVHWGLHHQVFLPGTFDELLDVFQAADVFVAATPASDGGQFLLEAMAAGLPAVAADSADHRAILEHGVHGLFVPAGDRTALAEAIGNLLDDPKLASEYGEAARRRVLQCFAQARMAMEHLQLFERLVDIRRRGKG